MCRRLPAVALGQSPLGLFLSTLRFSRAAAAAAVVARRHLALLELAAAGALVETTLNELCKLRF
jgi:hypothetical protein